MQHAVEHVQPTTSTRTSVTSSTIRGTNMLLLRHSVPTGRGDSVRQKIVRASRRPQVAATANRRGNGKVELTRKDRDRLPDLCDLHSLTDGRCA